MKPMSEAAKGTAKAIERIRERGWWDGGNKVPNNGLGHCLITSYLPTVGMNIPYSALYKGIDEVRPGFVHEKLLEGHSDCRVVTAFNDHPDTTRADVDAVMQRALSILIQEGAG